MPRQTLVVGSAKLSAEIPLEERLAKKKAELSSIRDTLRLQLDAIENQLFIIEELLNPEEPTNQEPEPLPDPPGTI